MLRRTGIIDPSEERRAEHGKANIKMHLAAFEKSLAKRTEKHATLTMTRVRRVVEETECQTIRDLDSERVENFLRELLDEGEMGHRTYNHYLQAVESFGNWLVATKRLIANPILGLERLNAATNVRHKRRALTAVEVSSHIESARSSGVRFRDSPARRGGESTYCHI